MPISTFDAPVQEPRISVWVIFFQNTFETPAQLMGTEMDKERYLNVYAERFPGLISGVF